jgi:AraC-like DNA-binding protein
VLLTLATYESNRRFKVHTHEHPGFFLLLSGQHRELKNTASLDQDVRSVIFHDPNEPHATETGPNGMVGLNISFESEWLRSMDTKPTSLMDSAVGNTKALAIEAIQLFSVAFQELGSDADVDTIGLDLLGLLTSSTEKRPPKWLMRARAQIESDFMNPISLSTLAAEVSVHPNYLARVFRQFFGCSVYGYLHQVRLLEAMKVVDEGGSLGDAALRSGFSDQAHLSRLCRRQFRVAPGSLRSLMNQCY